MNIGINLNGETVIYVGEYMVWLLLWSHWQKNQKLR